MKKTLSALLFVDIGWKLLALLSAILLWVIVMNIDNPLLKWTITRSISLINEDSLMKNGFMIDQREKIQSNVRLIVRAKQQDLSKLYNQSIITASIDLSSIDESYFNQIGKPISMSLIIDVPPGYEVLDKKPESIPIYIDKIVTESKTISVNPIGAVKDGYENMSAVFNDTVEVTAPKTVLDTIASIRADISIKGADKDIVINEAPLHVFDQDNNNITDSVTLSVESIKVHIPVYPVKEVEVKPRWGAPRPGYWVSDVEVSPKTVEIVGPADLLDEFNAIELKPIQLNNVTADKSVDFNIWEYLQNTKLTIRRGGVFNVNVTIRIQEEASKNLSLSTSNIYLINGDVNLDILLPSDPIPVTIRGPANAVSKITNSNLTAELDLSGLSAGIHDVNLHFDLHSSVSIVNKPVKVRVVISEENSTATVFPTDTTAFDNTEEPRATATESNINTEDNTRVPDSFIITPPVTPGISEEPTSGSEPPTDLPTTATESTEPDTSEPETSEPDATEHETSEVI